MAQRLPRFEQAMERLADTEKLEKILAAADAANLPTRTARGATAAGDARRLRGIPAVGRGITGALPGTSPHNAV